MFGIGLDIAGAVLVAKGLLIGPEQMFQRTGTRLGFSAPVLIGFAEDWCDGAFGVGALVGGFIFQAVGYAVVVDGRHAGVGTARAAVGILCAVAAAVLVSVLWVAFRRRLLLRRILMIARVRSGDPKPDGTLLFVVAHELGYRQKTVGTMESAAEFIKQVYKVDEFWVSSDLEQQIEIRADQLAAG
jgi:hypothetical protein